MSKSIRKYGPPGLRLIRCGTFLEIWSKSESGIFTPNSEAIAGRCRQVLVEPPMAISALIAFLKLAALTYFRGQRCSLTRRTISRPVCLAILAFLSLSAWEVPLPGRLRPSTSVRQDIVFAVNSPAQDPGPGHACLSISATSISAISPAS
jgi:hypothetical protein